MGMRVEDDGESESRAVMAWIRIEILSAVKTGPRLTGIPL